MYDGTAKDFGRQLNSAGWRSGLFLKIRAQDNRNEARPGGCDPMYAHLDETARVAQVAEGPDLWMRWPKRPESRRHSGPHASPQIRPATHLPSGFFPAGVLFGPELVPQSTDCHWGRDRTCVRMPWADPVPGLQAPMVGKAESNFHNDPANLHDKVDWASAWSASLQSEQNRSFEVPDMVRTHTPSSCQVAGRQAVIWLFSQDTEDNRGRWAKAGRVW